jgi:hypothetical protein
LQLMSRFITCGLAALGLLIAGSAAATTLYRWVDAQGVVHYSDTPQPGAEKIEIQSAQTYRAPAAAKSTTAAQKPATQAAAYQCSITTPTPAQSFYNPEAVAISVSVSPELVAGDQLVVTVDGSPVPASGQDFQVAAPERGDHTIGFAVRDSAGKTACTAAPVIFNVQRPSLLSPTSPAKGH